MKQQFPFAVGVELTGIRREYSVKMGENNNEVLTNATSRLISVEMALRYPRNYLPAVPYRDIHCIEFPSPIFTTLGEMKRFYDIVMAQFAKYYVSPQHPEVICGGNHLHFELNNLEWVQKVLRDSMRRPWIPWVFTQPDDTESCCNYDNEHLGVHLREAERYTQRMTENTLRMYNCPPYNIGFYHMLATNAPFPEGTLWANITGNKKYAFSFDWSGSSRSKRNKRFHEEKAFVLEIRCVEAPLDWSEMVDQLDFFIRYVNYVKAQPMPKGRLHLWTREKLQAIRRKDCVKEFYALLHQLGLDPKRYEKYVRRNLYTRWNLKRKRV